MAGYIMGIDNGSTMIKVGIYDLDGHECGVCGNKCESVSPRPGWYERDMDAIWEANKASIIGAMTQAGVKGSDIVAISLTGHGNGAHLVDQTGNGVRNSIEGADGRAADYVRHWTEDGTFARIHPMNMQALWPALSLCVMAWLRDHEPESLEKAKWFFNVKDYIRFKLTGEAYLEYSDATGCGLLNTRDRKIDPDMLDIAGLRMVADKLPPVRFATDQCGKVTREAAEQTGLAEGIPVAAGCYDIDSAGLATGMTDESLINVIVGSWCNNQFISKTPVVSEQFFSTTAYAMEDYYLMLEGSPTSASNLEWFVSEFLGIEKVAAKAAGRSIYETCNEAVRNTQPEDSGLVFLPFLYGSNVNPKARGVLLGMEGWCTRAHVIRAIYEGICFSHKWHIEKMSRYCDLRGKRVRMAGGAARSGIWRQMFADILGMPIEVTGAEELGTLGAAMCAAVCIGAYRNLEEAARHMVRVVDRVDPNPAHTGIYQSKYEDYLKAIETLDQYWGSKNDF